MRYEKIMVLSENVVYLGHQGNKDGKVNTSPSKRNYIKIKLNSLKFSVLFQTVSNCFHGIQVQKRQFNISKKPYKYLNNTGYSNAYTLNLKQIAANRCINLFFADLEPKFLLPFVSELLRHVSLIIKPVFL